jgi:predicted phosphoribosyltransferase
MNSPFRDRTDAGQELAQALARNCAGRHDLVVLALPRGGAPVGFAVAKTLGAPLDIFLVRKIGVPGFEELAMGAIASGGIRVLNEDVLDTVPNAAEALDRVTAAETEELARREAQYRRDRRPLDLQGRTVILVDDGLATGATMRAAIAAIRCLATRKIIVAIPVGPRSSCEKLRADADEVVCLVEPDNFESVGQFYADFRQTTDEEVCALLAEPTAA